MTLQSQSTSALGFNSTIFPVDFAIATTFKIERNAILNRLDEYEIVQKDFEPLTYCKCEHVIRAIFGRSLAIRLRLCFPTGLLRVERKR